MNYLRVIVSIILGLAVGGLAIFSTEHFITTSFDYYKGIEYFSNEEELHSFTSNFPTKVLIALMGSRLAGALIGGFLAHLFSGIRRFSPALSTGVLFGCFFYLDATANPHATWYIIAVTSLAIPAAYIGYKTYLTIVTDPR